MKKAILLMSLLGTCLILVSHVTPVLGLTIGEEANFYSAPVIRRAPVEDPIIRRVPVEDPIIRRAPVEDPIIRRAPVEDPIIRRVPVEDPIIRRVPVEDPIIRIINRDDFRRIYEDNAINEDTDLLKYSDLLEEGIAKAKGRDDEYYPCKWTISVKDNKLTVEVREYYTPPLPPDWTPGMDIPMVILERLKDKYTLDLETGMIAQESCNGNDSCSIREISPEDRGYSSAVVGMIEEVNRAIYLTENKKDQNKEFLQKTKNYLIGLLIDHLQHGVYTT